MKKLRTHIDNPEGADRVITDLWIDEEGRRWTMVNIEINNVHVCSVKKQDIDGKLWEEMTR